MTSYKDKVAGILSKRETPPLFYIRSFGCQQNVSDGEKTAGLLYSMGCGVSPDIASADIIIYNTCAVRESAELKIYGMIGELKHLKEKNPELIIGICGCMAQEEKTVKKILSVYKQVDLIFGTFALEELPRLLYEVLANRKTVSATDEYGMKINEGIPVLRTEKFKASVPVMYGCDNFCSYCIVPYVRGRERSRRPSDILNEVRTLAESGCREIMLLGQNVNSYGKGLDEKINFSGLLRLINETEGDFRIRFMSSHPKDADFELIDTIIECGKVCKHLHLPVQSGSSRILKEMNRGYTAEKYKEIIDYARMRMHGFSFSTDIIVGFPNETGEDFRETLDMLDYVRFDNIFSFIYSKRTGTKAALLTDNTLPENKSERMRILLEKQKRINEENYKRFKGRILDVLFDGKSKTPGYISGKSDEFIIAEALCEDLSVIGSQKKVRVTETMNWAVRGEIV